MAIRLLLLLQSFAAVSFGLAVGNPNRRSESTWLDGPHVPLATANTTATSPWAWWYFDAVATPPAVGSLQVVYYSGYGFGQIYPTPWYLTVNGNFENGTAFSFHSQPTGNSVVRSGEDGSDGTWPGSGTWTSSGVDGTGEYDLTFGSEAAGVYGTLKLKSRSPPHYPCDNNSPPTFVSGALNPNLLGPSLGWANAVPSADAQVSLTFTNYTETWDGTGYHDQNFGTTPLPNLVDTWYWGRGVAGKYTFVYFLYKPKGTDQFYTSGYLADDTGIIANECTAEQTAAESQTDYLTYTKTGPWPASPLNATASPPLGVGVTFAKGERNWAFSLTGQILVVEGSSVVPYFRWSATASGGEVNSDGSSEQETGTGMFEWLSYGA
ncbi:hypothetical protein BOTBODRAFT_31700 [Botryobasidium botryosum FD-172 SS1]|uniref:AttH domain-containing protein n=1 Tax=Botryobasidium botryosum (strain FD-172 SS1) TaxID=930990 RepID=A0A067ML01_BOTB1|nr:hypothetical protein BOTBODRAFT_31700 [Botryobasidium botryosum FD-172 SS1]